MRISLNSESIRLNALHEGVQGTAAWTVDNAVSAASVIREAAQMGMRRAGASIVRVEGENAARLAQWVVNGFFHGAYRISKEVIRTLGDDVFSVRDQLCDFGEGVLCIDCDEDISEAVREALIVARCEGYARMLGTLPNNFLHVRQMAAYMKAMAADCGLSCTVMGDAELKKLHSGGILAVNQGSADEAALVVLKYEAEGAPVGLVGKGVMFDAGGYHLKDIDGMKGMQSDMCGAAVAASTVECIARLHGRHSLYVVTPLVENVISPDAVKMGDVITTMEGKTVEIYNTDAEGRLILCDGLTCAQRLGAKTVADIATLTYGAQGALGNDIGGYFSNNDALARRAEDTARGNGEALWRLPLNECYHKALQWSECADFANYAPGYHASACTAAAFLEEFIHEGTEWLHIDVVGPSTNHSGSHFRCKGATGFGLKTLVEMFR